MTWILWSELYFCQVKRLEGNFQDSHPRLGTLLDELAEVPVAPCGADTPVCPSLTLISERVLKSCIKIEGFLRAMQKTVPASQVQWLPLHKYHYPLLSHFSETLDRILQAEVISTHRPCIKGSKARKHRSGMSNLWHGRASNQPLRFVSEESEKKLKCTPMLTAWEISRMEATVQLENHGLIAITETWWDESPKCNTKIEGYKLFGRGKQGRRGEGVAVYVKKWIDGKELPLKNNHGQVESLWG